MLWWPHVFKLLCCIHFSYYYIFKAQVVLSLSIEASWNWLLSFFDVTLGVQWLPYSWVYQHVLRLNVFYCWVTNYHIFQVLKCLCLLSNTCVVPKSITVWFSAQSLTRLKLKCWRSCIIRRFQERIWLQAYLAFPKIRFLQAVGLNSHFLAGLWLVVTLCF